MIGFWDVIGRSQSGPLIKEKEFDLQLGKTARRLVEKYEIKYDPQQVVPSDNELADRVYQAGLDLFKETGIYCRDTGQVMKFRVVPLSAPDDSEIPMSLSTIESLVATNTRQVSLNEEESQYVCVEEKKGKIVQINVSKNKPGTFEEKCTDKGGEVFGPTAALLGTLDDLGNGVPLLWSDDITENPELNSTEIWEIYNATGDAHPGRGQCRQNNR